MAQFTVTAHIDPAQVKKLEKALGAAAAQVKDAAWLAIRKTTEDARNVAIDNVPVDMGTLKQSIKTDYTKTSGRLMTQMRYAAAVEFGSRPHFPPVAPLVGWVRRNRAKLGVKDKDIKGVAFAIARKIAKSGTKARPYFKPALKHAQENYMGNMESAIRKVLNNG